MRMMRTGITDEKNEIMNSNKKKLRRSQPLFIISVDFIVHLTAPWVQNFFSKSMLKNQMVFFALNGFVEEVILLYLFSTGN